MEAFRGLEAGTYDIEVESNGAGYVSSVTWGGKDLLRESLVLSEGLDPQPIQDNSLFESLRKDFRLGLLSNTDPIHVAYMEETFDFFRYFPKSTRTYSCVVGSSKPSPLIFRDALKSLHAKAESSVFIDDIEAYVNAARSLGLRGIHYQSPAQLRSDLRALGVSLPD